MGFGYGGRKSDGKGKPAGTKGDSKGQVVVNAPDEPEEVHALAGLLRERSSSDPALVVAVTGSTRSGKSMLAKGLCQVVNELAGERVCSVIGQDGEFFRKGNAAYQDPETWIHHSGKWKRNFEHPNQTLWDGLNRSIIENTRHAKLVLVEGFGLLHGAEGLDCLIWMDISKNVCMQRRQDAPRDWNGNVADYMDMCIWPAHERYRNLVFGDSECLGVAGRSASFGGRVLQLSGTADPQQIRSQAAAVVLGWCKPPPVIVRALTDEEKQAMKLAKVLRDTAKLEAQQASGGAMDAKQLEKIARKQQVMDEFAEVSSSLPDDSDIIAKVQDLL